MNPYKKTRLLLIALFSTALFRIGMEYADRTEVTDTTNPLTHQNNNLSISNNVLTDMTNDHSQGFSTPVAITTTSSTNQKTLDSTNNMTSSESIHPYHYYTWQEKMDAYYNGRHGTAVPYPHGLDFKGTEQLSDNVYAINRQQFLEQSTNHDLLSHASFDDSNSSAVVLNEIVPGGIFDRIGIVPGDQISAMNNIPVHSYDELYSAYMSIQTTNQFDVHLQRNGQDINLSYIIH
ncbi:MAG: hypothetical protein OEX12_07420 [Gammaproteobacteria bacterium]|nr:hypothetical protein [Gammaproteobacteria bacterium]